MIWKCTLVTSIGLALVSAGLVEAAGRCCCAGMSGGGQQQYAMLFPLQQQYAMQASLQQQQQYSSTKAADNAEQLLAKLSS